MSWLVVLAAAAGCALGTVHIMSTGVMIAPIEREFGWSRATISSGLMINACVNAIVIPLIGVLIDRIGARRIALGGTILYCLSVACLSLTVNVWTWWITWFVVAIAGACISGTIWAAGVSGLFNRARGMALALTFTGTSVGAMLVPGMAQVLVDGVGWRNAYLGLAGGWTLVALPLVFLYFTSSTDRNRGAASTAPASRPRSAPAPAARPVFTSSSFIKIALAALAYIIAYSSLMTNYVPILISEGISAGRAAALAGLLGVGSVIGRITGGYLLDRINANIVAGVSVLMPVITCVLLLVLPGSIPAAVVAVVAMGFATGVEYDALAYLASRHFGVHKFGTVFGTLSGGLMLATGVSPFVTSHVYDVTGSYAPALWAFMPICLFSSFLFFSLGAYPPVQTAQDEEAR